MDRFTELYNAFIEKGFSEETASRLAEFINDAGIDEIKEVLNNLE